MDRPRQLDDLADELISDILSFLLLSCEHPSSDASPISFHQDAAVPSNGIIISPTTAYAYGERSELDRFRLVCRRFMHIATPRKFPRFVLRFSLDGFQRLEELLHMQLACHVRYFTYMVRPFYQGSGTDSARPAHSATGRELADTPHAQAGPMSLPMTTSPQPPSTGAVCTTRLPSSTATRT